MINNIKRITKKVTKILKICDNPQMFFENNDLIIIDGLAKWVLFNAKNNTVIEIFSIYNGGLK